MQNKRKRDRLRTVTSRLISIATVIALHSVFFPPALAQSPDGFWESDGYGLLVHLEGTTMAVFQTTSISCLPWWTAQRSDDAKTPGAWVFKNGFAEGRLTPGPSVDELLMEQGPSVSAVSLRRRSDRPKACVETPANTPLQNYEVFWHTFAEQFALFPLYRTDWAAVDRKFRPQVMASTTPDELFGILREMILPFHNAHTNINATSIHRQYIGYRLASDIGRRLDGTTSLSIEQILAFFSDQAVQTRNTIEARYAGGGLKSYANDKLYFGMVRDSIGYVQILAFEDYAREGGFERDAAALEAALDQIFADSAGMTGLIVDVRTNLGGADPLCLAIASRLNGAKYLAYSKVTRNNLTGRLHFTAPQPRWVELSGKPGYRGKVALLLGPDTLSGGETFAMALRERTPRIAFIGENTQGVFSDVWGRKLPNGWTFGLPTELYLTNRGQSFDGRGVAPDIRVPIHTKVDLEERRDGALERAIQVLAK
jgi:hypothetical protein